MGFSEANRRLAGLGYPLSLERSKNVERGSKIIGDQMHLSQICIAPYSKLENGRIMLMILGFFFVEMVTTCLDSFF